MDIFGGNSLACHTSQPLELLSETPAHIHGDPIPVLIQMVSVSGWMSLQVFCLNPVNECVEKGGWADTEQAW